MNHKLTNGQVMEIEEKHNVYVDRDTMQYNIGGGYDAIYGWQPIPKEWIDETKEND